MAPSTRLISCFVRALGIAESLVTPSLSYNTIPEWDSVGHMALVAELENEYGLMLDTDEIIGLSSVNAAIALLTKHGVSDAA